MLKTYQFHLASLFLCLAFLSGCGQNSSSSMQANAASSQNLEEGVSEQTDYSAEIAILKHPQSINIGLNSGFSLNVTTKSNLPLRYQWYKNSLAIPGANTPTYSVSQSVEEDQGLYHVVVSNETASLSSYSATVTVNPVNSYLKITREPLSKTLTSGQPLQLQVEVGGEGPFSYQWYKNGAVIAGANADTYQITSSRLSDSGHYQVQVSNRFATVESGFASITINDAIVAPAEISISVQPQSTRITENHPFTLRVMASSQEELHYQWYKNDQAINGAVDASYTKPVSSSLDEGVYYVLINNQQRSIKSHAAFVQINHEITPLTITQPPQSTTLSSGQTLFLQVEAVGEGQLVYQWYKNGILISGANASILSIPEAHPSDSGLYQVRISNGASSVESGFANITIHSEASRSDTDTITAPLKESAETDVNKAQAALAIIQAPQNKTITEGDALLLQIQVSGDGPLTYQWQKNGSLLPYASHSNFFIPSANKSDQASYRVIISNSSQTIYSDFINVWVTDRIEPVTILSHPVSQLVPLGSNKQLSVEADGGGFITYQWRKNGEAILNAYSSTLTLTDLQEDDAGYYDVVVSNSQGSKVSYPAYLDILSSKPGFWITEQPQSQLIRTGQPLSLSVSAQSDTDLSYQWFLNGNPIAGANTATYHIMQAGLQDAGTYSVMMSDVQTSQHSLPAEVSIYEPDTYAVELSWDTPNRREDGSPLKSDEILEYVIEYGYEDHLLNQRITVPHRSINSHILEGVYPGQLMLRIATVDIDGHQGNFSDVIGLIID